MPHPRLTHTLRQLGLLCAMLCCISPLAMHAQSLDELSQASASLTTLEAHFTQTKYSALLKQPAVMQGRLWFDNPRSLRWEYVSPEAQTLIVSHDSLCTRTATQQHCGALADNRIAKHLMPMIMNLMSGKSLTDKRTFNISTSTTDTEVVVELVPARKQMQRAFAKITLRFNRQTRLISSVELQEKADTRTLITFDHIRVGQPLPASIFNINTLIP